MDENTAIHRVCQGDADAYRPLVERYQTGLIIHCERLVGSRSDAEDIAQESFVRAYDKLAEFDTKRARFSTWLYRIATNKAIDHLRKSRRTVDYEDLDRLVDEAVPPSMELDEKEALRTAVDTLHPPKFSAIIKAYYWEGKSYQQIASAHNTTTGTVDTWMRRAKQQLKEKLS